MCAKYQKKNVARERRCRTIVIISKRKLQNQLEISMKIVLQALCETSGVHDGLDDVMEKSEGRLLE